MISLFVGEERKAKRERLGDPLQVLDQHIDFAALAKAVDAKAVIELKVIAHNLMHLARLAEARRRASVTPAGSREAA